MPRYFFNVCAGAFEEMDAVGRPCSNDVAALREAFAIAGAVLRRRPDGDAAPLDGSIEVEDERHRPVLSLPLRSAAY
jgi:hypothetical protein